MRKTRRRRRRKSWTTGSLPLPPPPWPSSREEEGVSSRRWPAAARAPRALPPPLLGFGALELALASGPTGGGCNDELDLQLFQRDGVVAGATAAGGGGGGGGTPSVGGGTPALRFPCHVCGKRFRFQSILSLHARAHSLDRDRRASALYRTALPLQQHLKAQPNRKDPNLNLKQQRPLALSLIQQHLREEEEEGDGGTRADQHHTFILDESNPLTPPLTEDPPVSLASPYPTPGAPSGAGGEAGSVLSAPAFRCHACKGKFRTASELARHVRILHNPYKCTLCPFSASQEERLACHLQECHPSPDAPPVPPAYTSRPVVVVAVAPDTPVATPPVPVPVPVPVVPQPATAPPAAGGGGVAPTLPAFRCETCGQRFTQSWFLKGHMRKHKDSLDHKCQVCGRGFKEPWFLKNHMKVHLNKLGLKAGLGALGALGGLVGADPQAKGPVSNQSLNALYSSLLLAQRGGGGGGGGGRGGRGRSERDSGSRGGLGPSKAALLSYLGLPSEGGGASCMERLQAVAQVAEMGNGGGVGGGGGGSGGAGDPGRGGGGRGGDVTSSLADGGDQAAMWQLVARSLVAAQQAQHQQQQQQQQQRSQQQQQHRAAAAAAAQQGQRGPGRGSVIGEADQVRAYLGALDPREEAVISGGGAGGGPWECPDCGKLFRSLQQVVVHARVHTQRHGHKGGGGGGGGEEEESAGASRSGAGGGRAGGGCEGRQEAKLLGGGTTQQAARFHSIISTFQGENDLTAVTSGPSTPGRERVRGSGVKDCPYCGKAFRSSHHLKVHLRVHTGERPYKCPHCDYAGTQSGSLKYHLQRHHREQRNALSASSSSSSSSSSTTSNTSLTSAINSLVSGGSGQAKQRRSQMLSHGPVSRGPAESPLSRHGQQPWLLGLPDHKALATLRDVDLESQYRYLSGVMGALYQGGMEGGWIRESPPPKAPKVSRRKPLTTSRMVQPSNGSANEGSAPSAQAVGGFEPLDLSRRPSPGLGGPEEDGAMSVADVAGGGGSGLGTGAGDSMVGVTLSQCLFCPFRTASSELMAMHLQVNHTSKSRRKRGSSVALDDDAPPKAPQLRADVADPDPLAVWRYVTQSEDQVPLAEWASSRSQTLNGLLEDAGEQRERDLNRRASVRVASAASANARGGLAPEAKMDEDEELEEEEEDDEEEEEEEELEMMGENGSLEDGLRMPLSLSPALSSDHMAMEEDRLLAD